MIECRKWLQHLDLTTDIEQLSSLMQRRFDAAPEWLDADSDVWNLASIQRISQKKILNIDFRKIKCPDLRRIAKCHAAYHLVDRGNAPGSILRSRDSFKVLDRVLKGRPPNSLCSADFAHAEAILLSERSHGGAARQCHSLTEIGDWLRREFGFRINYKFSKMSPYLIAKDGGDNDDRTLPDEVIAALLSFRNEEELSDRDRFFINLIAISVCTGFRTGELVTLPADCVIDDGGTTLIRNFASKGGKAVPRPVPPELGRIVEDAVDYIRRQTESARNFARVSSRNGEYSWRLIVEGGNLSDFEHFFRNWLGRWIDDPVNRLIDPDYVFVVPRGKRGLWIEMSDRFERHKGNVSAMSRELGLSRPTIDSMVEQWRSSQNGLVFTGNRSAASQRSLDTDVRFPSLSAFKKFAIPIHPKNACFHLAQRLIGEACSQMLANRPFARSEIDPLLVEKYLPDTNVLVDPQSGKSVLRISEALFAVYRNQFSTGRQIEQVSVRTVTSSSLGHWISGYSRDRGKGVPTDAVCARLGITDPRTGEVAKFTIMNFRHWLNTAYENGGLTQEQIATVFNRSTTSANRAYSHTPRKLREERLREAMKAGSVVGHYATAFRQIAEESPSEAEEFLRSATRFYNPMPHGICRMNWALEPCPHMLSCFTGRESGTDGEQPSICEHLLIDQRNGEQMEEVARISRNSLSAMQLLEEEGASDGPQYKKFRRIHENAAKVLSSSS